MVISGKVGTLILRMNFLTLVVELLFPMSSFSTLNMDGQGSLHVWGSELKCLKAVMCDSVTSAYLFRHVCLCATLSHCRDLAS